MTVPTAIENKLSDQVWKRSSQSSSRDALLELGVSPSDPFCEFYSRFQGPFGSKKVGHELLDLCRQKESVVVNTRVVREELGLASRFVVLTSMIGLSVLIYDLDSGCVFDVDFEGGDKLLAEGRLPPRWRTWWDFAGEYFS
jgi:hypothetical protein